MDMHVICMRLLVAFAIPKAQQTHSNKRLFFTRLRIGSCLDRRKLYSHLGMVAARCGTVCVAMP